jgi:hypothetical protein
MVKYRIFVFLLSVFVLVFAGGFAILYARGYRFGLGDEKQITLSPKGILVANSDPNGAQVYVNGELSTATNNTVFLAPNEYDVEVKKEGFLTWKKHIKIDKETVTQIDAYLIPSAPSLSALTFSGVFNVTLSNDYSKIAYGVPPSDDKSIDDKAGLYVLETVNLPLGFNRDPKRITDGDLTKATWEWSPEGREILLTTEFGTKYLLDTAQFTAASERVAIKQTELDTLYEQWDELKNKRLESQISQVDDPIETILSEHMKDIKFSPDENRILYEASGSASLPTDAVEQLPGSSTQDQARDIEDGNKYVYDIKEDRNFKVGEKDESLAWIPNSLNLLLPKPDKIIVLDYDGTNRQTVFSGNYEYPYAFPSTSAGRILVLTNFGGQEYPNLYWLSLR